MSLQQEDKIISEISKKNIAKHLYEAGFTHVFKGIDTPPTEAYVKEIGDLEVEIEFLTDSATRHDKDKNVIISGIVAQPLNYLTLSLQTTMKFETHSHEAGLVVSPDAWMFHKGLTFTRRKDPSKVLKDLYGIWYVSTQLGAFSEQAIEKFHTLTRQNPKWLSTLQKNLRHWVEEASPAKWLSLESQDPSGRLKRLNFERTINQLCSV